MSKSVLRVVVTLALGFAATAAQAGPITMCTADTDYHCTLVENSSTHVQVTPADWPDPIFGGNLPSPGWLIGYTFLLEPGAVYDGTNNSVISDVVVIHPDFVELFSDDDPLFAAMIASSLQAINQEQVIGDLSFLGADQIHSVGLAFEDANGYALLTHINGGLFSSNDTIAIYSDVPAIVLPPPTNGEVPEPTTIALLSTGLIGAAIRRRRSRAQA